MILTVLKIIGIVLLVILGLLIFILGILLFVPIRYQFAGSSDSGLEADVMVKWMPVLLNVTASYKDKKAEYVIKLFGGVVMTNTDAKLSWLGKKFFSFDEEKAEQKNSFVVISDEDEIFSKEEIHDESNESKQGDYNESIRRKRKNSKKQNRSLAGYIQQKRKTIRVKIHELIDKIKEINKKKENLLKVYHSKRFEVAKKDIICYMKQLLLIIKPDELEGNIHFGMEDPADTGQILGIAAMALPLYDEFLTIQPDFEQACIEGNLKGKGKVRLFPLVKLALKVIFNKNLIKVTKKVQTIMES